MSEAARHLNQPTTTVSRKIKQLEEEPGTLLLHRTTRTQSLTEAGDAVLPKAEAVLASLQELSDEVSQKTHSPKGALNISGPATVLRDFAAMFAEFSRNNPDISLQFESSSRYQNLIDDRLDFAFRLSRGAVDGFHGDRAPGQIHVELSGGQPLVSRGQSHAFSPFGIAASALSAFQNRWTWNAMGVFANRW